MTSTSEVFRIADNPVRSSKYSGVELNTLSRNWFRFDRYISNIWIIHLLWLWYTIKLYIYRLRAGGTLWECFRSREHCMKRAEESPHLMWYRPKTTLIRIIILIQKCWSIRSIFVLKIDYILLSPWGFLFSLFSNHTMINIHLIKFSNYFTLSRIKKLHLYCIIIGTLMCKYL